MCAPLSAGRDATSKLTVGSLKIWRVFSWKLIFSSVSSPYWTIGRVYVNILEGTLNMIERRVVDGTRGFRWFSFVDLALGIFGIIIRPHSRGFWPWRTVCTGRPPVNPCNGERPVDCARTLGSAPNKNQMIKWSRSSWEFSEFMFFFFHQSYPIFSNFPTIPSWLKDVEIGSLCTWEEQIFQLEAAIPSSRTPASAHLWANRTTGLDTSWDDGMMGWWDELVRVVVQACWHIIQEHLGRLWIMGWWADDGWWIGYNWMNSLGWSFPGHRLGEQVDDGVNGVSSETRWEWRHEERSAGWVQYGSIVHSIGAASSKPTLASDTSWTPLVQECLIRKVDHIVGNMFQSSLLFKGAGMVRVKIKVVKRLASLVLVLSALMQCVWCLSNRSLYPNILSQINSWYLMNQESCHNKFMIPKNPNPKKLYPSYRLT